MSILDKIRGNEETDEAVRMKSPKPGRQLRKNSPSSGTKRRNSRSDDEGDHDIDIRLDSDLDEYAEKSKRSHFKDPDVDFDLADPEHRTSKLVETQVLSINPTKSFSRQADVNLKKLGDAGFITPDMANTLLSSTFRQLKRPVLNNVRGKGATVVDNANLVMLTSSVAGEGKTFSAINMAMSIAMERDKRVLLIDADVNHPSHHEFFGIEMEGGLTDILTGNVDDISKVIYKTNMPSLSLMFAGTRTPHAPELFSSKTMERFVTELSARYEDRVIIFDSAPLLLLTEAAVLASHMGQIILVIEAEKTSHTLVKRSLEMLSNRIILLLLNKMREKNDLGGYGYYRQHEG